MYIRKICKPKQARRKVQQISLDEANKQDIDDNCSDEIINLKHAEYVDNLLNQDKAVYLNFINDVERKAGIIISVIAIVLSLEVTFLPKLMELKAVENMILTYVVYGIFTAHIVCLVLSIIFSALGYSTTKYTIFGSGNIAKKYVAGNKSVKIDSVLQNISNNLYAKDELGRLINKKSCFVSKSMLFLIISGIGIIISLIIILWFF